MLDDAGMTALELGVLNGADDDALRLVGEAAVTACEAEGAEARDT